MQKTLPPFLQRAVDAYPKVLEALRVAEQYHRDQKPRGTADGREEPYVNHCIRVAENVAKLNHRPEVIMAALLHDTLEDTHLTYAQLLAAFGDQVARLVVELTDVYTPGKIPRSVRKTLEADRLGRTSPCARLIKLMDVLDNAESIEAKEGNNFAETWRLEKDYLVYRILN